MSARSTTTTTATTNLSANNICSGNTMEVYMQRYTMPSNGGGGGGVDDGDDGGVGDKSTAVTAVKASSNHNSISGGYGGNGGSSNSRPNRQQQQQQHQEPSPAHSDTTSTSSVSSPPQYSDDLRRNMATLDFGLARQGSGSSTKTCEVDLGEAERDTYSPITNSSSSSGGGCGGATGSDYAGSANSSRHQSPSETATAAAGIGLRYNGSGSVDNKVYDGMPTTPTAAAAAATTSSGIAQSIMSSNTSSVKSKVSNSGLSGSSGSLGLHGINTNSTTTTTTTTSSAPTTKEEKQRQNEEIVILETSSISSETGSWESVFPHATAAAAASSSSAAHLPAPVAASNQLLAGELDLRNCCNEFLQKPKPLKDKEKEKDHDGVADGSGGGGGAVLLKPEPDFAPYLRERTYSSGATATADTSSLFKGISASSLLREFDKRENALSTSGTSACFIDASSLRDEDEVLSFPSLDGHQSNDDLDAHEKDVEVDVDVEGEHEPEPLVDESSGTKAAIANEIPNGNATNGVADADDDSPTTKLETFHMSFARCIVKPKDADYEMSNPQDKPPTSHSSGSGSSSASGAESPLKADSCSSTNNLSDEEKLWQRQHVDEDDRLLQQLNKVNSPKILSHHHHEQQQQQQQQQYSPTALEDASEASFSPPGHEAGDSSDSSEHVKLRRDMSPRAAQHRNMHQHQLPERSVSQPTPHYIFQHNLQQFSILPLSSSPKFTAHSSMPPPSATQLPHAVVTAAAHSDLSYTTDYSSSSPAPSLAWSEYEHQHQSSSAGHHAVRLHALGRHQSLQHQTPQSASSLHQTSHHQPDTPHNSIAHIASDSAAASSSNNSSIHRDCTLSSSLSHQRDSGAYCSDATDSPVPMPRTPKRSKFDEANPIVSGGACIKDFSVQQCASPPVLRKTDACPIVSGGFKSLDFEPTRPLRDHDDDDEDFGGHGEAADGELAGVELRTRPRTRKPLPGIASWVVDMSDCRSEGRKSNSSCSSLEMSGRFRERSDSTGSHKSGCGFFVSLDDMDRKPTQRNGEDGSAAVKASPLAMSKSYTAPKAAGFFVNLSHSEYAAKPPAERKQQHGYDDDVGEDRGVENAKGSEDPESLEPKKEIFSMFIDFGERKSNGSRKGPISLAQRLSSSLSSSGTQQQQGTRSASASSTETLMAKSGNTKTAIPSTSNAAFECEERETKSLDYRCNMDPPLTVAQLRRMSQQQRSQTEAAAAANKRHSWGTGQEAGATSSGVGEYKRSISLTAPHGEAKDGGSSGLMSIIDKLPLISKASSLSVDSSMSPYDDYTGSKSGLSTFSNNSARNSMSGGERDEDGVATTAAAAKVKKRRRDVQINETFDKSSLASITDGVLSKDLSPASTTATDTDDLTFQQDEELALREAAVLPAQAATAPVSNRSSAIIMETIIEAKETSSPKKSATGHTMESLHAAIEKQKQLLETVNEHAETTDQQQQQRGGFVKLSDMDKPTTHHSPEALMSKSVGNHSSSQRQHQPFHRLYDGSAKGSNGGGGSAGGMRPHSWGMTRSHGNSFLNITNSVDNLRSLSRLFPHFSKDFSNSLPNDVTLDRELDYIQTDLSADSSLTSSFSRSGMDESSISCRQPRRLGEDLLKMFLQELATDMVVEVHGRRIKAHKCILRSRCQYFAAMLAGSGSQQSSVVSLQGYSYAAVHFALCHIYSGASHPPDGISLMELAALADLLGLEGLKEVTAHALKTNYCHNFHKPCSGCIDGILQVLPVALNHALDDLYRKCLRWTCRHYLKVWPTRQFAQLPPDILGRCRQQIVAYLTSETVLDTVLDCDNLLAQLAPYRWGGICENLVRDILDAAYAYIADHFASLIASDAFLSLGHDRSCHIPRLESLLLRTAASLTADQACRSYQRITRLNTVLQAKVIQMPANLGELAKELQGLQEEELDWDVEYIRLVSAILSAVEQCLTRQCSRAMRVTAWQRMDLDLRKKIQTLARLTEPLDVKRGKPVSKAYSFGGNTRNQDLYQVKLAIQAHTKRALAHDTQLYKATQTQQHDANAATTAAAHVQTTERGVQANQHEPRESKILKSNSRAYVPQVQYRATSQSATGSERNSLNLHRRTQSEAPLPTASKSTTSVPKALAAAAAATASGGEVKPKLRLNEVRPRYLEPRKSRAGPATNGPVRSATSSSIPATKSKAGLHGISSSDSSRNSSPAARKSLSQRIGNKSTTNMSLDSLASPSRRKTVGGVGAGIASSRSKGADIERYADHHVDSQTESMQSSVITSKIHDSRESLTRSNPYINHMKATPPTVKKINNASTRANGSSAGTAGAAATATSSATPGSAKTYRRPTSMGNKTAKHLQQQNFTSAGSSPSSVTTTKSAASRLSSVSSTHSSRDLYKHRSISMPGQDSSSVATSQASSNTPQRRSFLSAKSREILAKRAEKNKQQQQLLQQQQQQQLNNNSSGDERQAAGGPQRSASHSAVTALVNNRNALPSSIPTRRPNSLQLKKTNATATAATNHKNAVNNSINNNKNNKMVNVATNGVLKAAHAVKQKLEMLIDTKAVLPAHDASGGGAGGGGGESKLERSSTFCKDSSDLERNELQIIE